MLKEGREGKGREGKQRKEGRVAWRVGGQADGQTYRWTSGQTDRECTHFLET